MRQFMKRIECRLKLTLLLVSYILYLVLLSIPGLDEYVVKASLALLFGALAYMIAVYIHASCSRPRGDSSSLTGTPIG